MVNKEKKPILKKWWFWTIIAVVAIGVLSSSGGDDKPADSNNPTAEPIEESVVQEISSLNMQDTDDQEITINGLNYKSWVKVDPSKFDVDDIEFVVMNPDICNITAGTETLGALWFEVVALSPGKTGVYAQTRDETVKSEVVGITVYLDKTVVETTIEDEIIIKDEIVVLLTLGILEDNFEGIADIELDKENKIFYITVTDPAFILEILNALEGDTEALKDWEFLVDTAKDLSESISENITGYSIQYLNPANTENTLLMVQDGVVLYNFIDD